MSSSSYPQGMNSYNNRKSNNLNLNTKQVLPTNYTTWKGSPPFSNPIGIASTHIRPLTNNDITNSHPTGFGLPRPIKHYRRGTIIPTQKTILTVDPNDESKLIETTLTDYNTNRTVESSKGNSLGLGLISKMISTPGGFIVKEKNILNDNETEKCQGVGVISSWYPISNLTENPETLVTNKLFCCNQQRKAIRRVMPASTIIKKDYYQNHKMLLYNRCQTFKQREFNFAENNHNTIKPGAPESVDNLYVAQCCNDRCNNVYYKPNNHQYAQQGAVSSSTRNLKLNVTTIEKNAFNQKQLQYQSMANDLQQGQNPNVPFIHKMKSTTCQASTYNRKPKICSINS